MCVLISLDPPSIAGAALLAGLTVLLIGSERVVAARPETGERGARRVPVAAVGGCRSAAGRGAARQLPGAGAQAACDDASAGGASRRRRSRRRRDDRARGRHRRARRSDRRSARDRRRADAPGGGRGAGGAGTPRGPPADRPGRERLRLGGRDRAAARLGGDSRRRIGDIVGRRSGAAARRRLGARRRSRSRAICGSSSITRAAASPRISSARTRPSSSPRTSIRFTGSGSMSPKPSGPTCIIAMSCGPHSNIWKNNYLAQTARPRSSSCARPPAPPTSSRPCLKARDFGRLRDMLRNRPASDLASMLTDLPTEDQVLVFRILPRREAAATFEYLSTDAQNALLKAMASEDVAALLNEMAPDDRTMFLEELPGRGDAAAARAPDAGGARRRGEAARISGRIDRALDDPALRRGAGRLDRRSGAGLHPRPRPGQRNAQRHLRRRREGAADRRHPHSRVPAHRHRRTSSAT